MDPRVAWRNLAGISSIEYRVYVPTKENVIHGIAA